MAANLKPTGHRLLCSQRGKETLALGIALAGVAIYLAFSIHFAFTQRSTIDEGLYLYKGYLFAKGIYHPYQDYGPHTEYSPLSYLIPGYIQLWFGPGLRTGRIFAIIIGILALVGLWATARKMAGAWWAVAAVWAVALNPALIRFYSLGISQGLVTCLLMWLLFLVMGKNPSIWQVSLSTALAGLLVFTRQNMAPVLPLLVLFIFWQLGRRQGLFALLTGTLVVTAGAALFWPGILKAWAPWFPARLTPFLNPWRLPSGGTPALSFQPDWITKLYTSLEGLRYHFIDVAGAILALVLWPARKIWKSRHQFRSAIFLAVLFFLLLVTHVWAGLGFSDINYGNAYTVGPYLAFFSGVGLLLAIAVFSNLPTPLSLLKQISLGLAILLLSTAAGYGSFLSTSDFLLHLPIPRIHSFLTTGQILRGVPIWDYLANRYGIAYNTSRWLIPTVSGFLIGGIILLIGFALRLFFRKKSILPLYSFGVIATVVFLVAGISLSPSVALGGGFNQWQCSMNVIAAYEQAGHSLAGSLSESDLMYWDGGNTVAILLYVPKVHIFPQQLDNQWNYFTGGNSEALSRLGFWNDGLALSWRDKANVITFQQADFPSWSSYLNSERFTELKQPEVPLDCNPDTYLRLFRKVGNVIPGSQ